MIKRVRDITSDVRVLLDENRVSESLFAEGDEETLRLDELIRSRIREGVRLVHLNAPHHLLEQGHNFGDAVYWREKGSGYVLLPADFMRLVVFSMSDWSRPVYEAILGTNAEYRRQRSRHKGLRGTPQRPVCAIVQRPEGLSMEFYSCKSEDAYVSMGVYIPEPRINSNDEIDISKRCYRSAISAIAGLSLVSIGESGKGETFLKIAKEGLR